MASKFLERVPSRTNKAVRATPRIFANTEVGARGRPPIRFDGRGIPPGPADALRALGRPGGPPGTTVARVTITSLADLAVAMSTLDGKVAGSEFARLRQEFEQAPQDHDRVAVRTAGFNPADGGMALLTTGRPALREPLTWHSVVMLPVAPDGQLRLTLERSGLPQPPMTVDPRGERHQFTTGGWAQWNVPTLAATVRPNG